MSINLTAEQERTVQAIVNWYRDPYGDQSFVLAGYAGTGKTTIAKAIIEALGVDDTICVTPTGKAARVLESKLPEGIHVSTIHSWLYAPSEVSEWMVTRAEESAEELRRAGHLFREEAAAADARAKRLAKILEGGGCEFRHKEEVSKPPLVIADESSMIGDRLEDDMRANAPKLLFLGDPGQLPPVEGRDFFERNKPNAILETIHRQAADSSILRFAHAIRNDEKFTDWDDACRVVRGSSISAEFLATGDVVLTGRNETRRGLNRNLRRHHGFSGVMPQQGELLMCLRNDHGRGLINGVPGRMLADVEETWDGDYLIDLAYEDTIMRRVPIDPFHFKVYQDPKMNRRQHPPHDAQFDFGYAITCHKAQGSEWPTVMVWDDKMRPNDVEARRRWIYTAATRASEKLVWINGKK